MGEDSLDVQSKWRQIAPVFLFALIIVGLLVLMIVWAVDVAEGESDMEGMRFRKPVRMPMGQSWYGQWNARHYPDWRMIDEKAADERGDERNDKDTIHLSINLNPSESFITDSSDTWDDYDNWGTKYGHTRAYWGSWDPSGGWTGSPYHPDADMTGAGVTVPVIRSAGRYRRSIPNYGFAEPDLVKSSDEELQQITRSQIMMS